MIIIKDHHEHDDDQHDHNDDHPNDDADDPFDDDAEDADDDDSDDTDHLNESVAGRTDSSFCFPRASTPAVAVAPRS